MEETPTGPIQSSSLVGFAPSSGGEDNRRRRIETRDDGLSWWVAILLLKEITRVDGGDAVWSARLIVLGGGF